MQFKFMLCEADINYFEYTCLYWPVHEVSGARTKHSEFKRELFHEGLLCNGIFYCVNVFKL
jgi:hypothetical protein